MLTILLSETFSGKCIEDIEIGFTNFMIGGIKNTDINHMLLKNIEDANYINETTFKDRRGLTLSIESLSTGCKGALLVANQSRPVNFLECGWNARDAVIRYCNSGTIIINDTERVIRRFDNNFKVIEEKIDVLFNGIHFTKLSEFNAYINSADW